MRKRQRKKNKSMKRAIESVFRTLSKMSHGEFEALLKKHEPTCTPDTCARECQGMGWCEECEEFQREIPRIIAEAMMLN